MGISSSLCTLIWYLEAPHTTCNQPLHSALRHQHGLNFLCLPLVSSSIPDARNSLSLGCWADLWMLSRCFLHTQQPQGLLHLICPASSTAQMAGFWQLQQQGGWKETQETWGQKQHLPGRNWGSALQSQLAQLKGKCLNPNHSCGNDAKPGFPGTFLCHYQNTSFCAQKQMLYPKHEHFCLFF